MLLLNIRLKSTGIICYGRPISYWSYNRYFGCYNHCSCRYSSIFSAYEATGEKGQAATPAPKDVASGVDKANTDAQTNCFTELPASPTCAQLKTYATCLDSVGIGINGTLEAVLSRFY